MAGPEPMAEAASHRLLRAAEERRLARRIERGDRAVASLGELAAAVIRARFGLDGDPAPQSYATVSARLGRSVRAVRAIDKRALRDWPGSGDCKA